MMGAGANKGKYVSRTFKHSSSLKNFVYKTGLYEI